jgi:hypothetical protein
MNQPTHVLYGKLAARTALTTDAVLSARPWLAEHHPEFFDACALPDNSKQIACRVGGRTVTAIWGHGLNSFGHFECNDGRGYRLLDDRSLSLAAPLAGGLEFAAEHHLVSALAPPLAGYLVALAEDAATMTVVMGEADGVTDVIGSPFVEALAAQPETTLDRFRFASAGQNAEALGRAALYWAMRGDGAKVRRCLGAFAHYLQDCYVPHHAAGVLCAGHTPFENDLEDGFREDFAEDSDDRVFRALLVPAVLSDLEDLRRFRTIGRLASEAAAWTRRRFPLDLPRECPGNIERRISYLAVAVTLRGLELLNLPAPSNLS